MAAMSNALRVQNVVLQPCSEAMGAVLHGRQVSEYLQGIRPPHCFCAWRARTVLQVTRASGEIVEKPKDAFISTESGVVTHKDMKCGLLEVLSAMCQF